jgi:hypothetical protein
MIKPLKTLLKHLLPQAPNARQQRWALMRQSARKPFAN